MTETQAVAVRDTIDAGLCAGLGKAQIGECCIIAAKRLALGLSHGDSVDGLPVGLALRALDIGLNDKNWSSNAARAKGLRRLALAEMGSDTLDQSDFSRRFTLKVIQRICPKLFRELAKLAPKDEDKSEMESAAANCETATDLKTILADIALALSLALDLDLARARARALARALDLALALALALDLALDEVFASMAELAVEVLQEMKCPGCELLYILEASN